MIEEERVRSLRASHSADESFGDFNDESAKRMKTVIGHEIDEQK